MNEQTKQAHFMTKINMSYEFKIAYAETRIREFITECAKINNCYPFLGLQATESHRRFLSLSKNGCNYFNGKSTRSAPFAIFNKSDVLRLAVEIGVPIPKIYGDITIKDNVYKTTGESRTGCDICGFGIQFEKTRPHRFDKLYIEDFKKWDFWINQMEYGKIFKHIGFKYEQPFVDGESAWVKNHE